MIPDSRRVSRLAGLLAATVLLAAGCDAGVVPSGTLARPTAQIDAAAWSVAICQASDQLSLAIVDPATGGPSAAWSEFEAAVAAGDEAEIDATANAVLGHLGQAARSANEALAFEPGFGAAVAWWDMVDALTGGVRDVRDGTIAEDAARVTEGRTAVQQAIDASYPQALGLMRAVELGGQSLPCG